MAGGGGGAGREGALRGREGRSYWRFGRVATTTWFLNLTKRAPLCNDEVFEYDDSQFYSQFYYVL